MKLRDLCGDTLFLGTERCVKNVVHLASGEVCQKPVVRMHALAITCWQYSNMHAPKTSELLINASITCSCCGLN